MRNESLFREIADIIEVQPQAYDQSDWFGRSSDGEAIPSWVDEVPDWCSTTGCIAGWAVTISQYNGNIQRAYDELGPYRSDMTVVRLPAMRALGLDEDDATRLFAEAWKPHDGLSVSDALRKIGEGARIDDVSAEPCSDECDECYGDDDEDDG